MLSLLQSFSHMDTTETEIYEKLIGAALRFVSYRPRSTKELRDFLAKKLTKNHTSAPQVIDVVLDRLAELGYADDEAFGTWWVTQRTGRKPKGAAMIAMELKQKGLDRDVIEVLLTRIMQGDRSERDLAEAAARAKFHTWRSKPRLEQKQKLANFLMRRGFSSEVIWSVVDDILSNV